MGYPSNRPEHVRTLMQNVHDRYAQGVDLFPKFRLKVQPEDLPKRSRQAAGLLVRAWERIDDDRAYFGSVLDLIKGVGSGLAVVKVGRNAVNMGYLDPAETEPEIAVMSVNEFEEQYGDTEFAIRDGRTFSYSNGDLHTAETDFTVVRESNANSVAITEEGFDRLAASPTL